MRMPDEEGFIKELTKIDGLGKVKAKSIVRAGFNSAEEIARADLEDLTEIEGVGESLASKIKETFGTIPEGEEGDYVAKAKPKLDAETLRLLSVRERQKRSKPEFKRYEWQKKSKLSKASWRRPRGLHNKLRRHIKAKGHLVEAGFGSPSAVRGYHSSGFIEVRVFNVGDLESLDAERHAVSIASGVSSRKRVDLERAAGELGLRVLNPVRSNVE